MISFLAVDVLVGVVGCLLTLIVFWLLLVCCWVAVVLWRHTCCCCARLNTPNTTTGPT